MAVGVVGEWQHALHRYRMTKQTSGICGCMLVHKQDMVVSKAAVFLSGGASTRRTCRLRLRACQTVSQRRCARDLESTASFTLGRVAVCSSLRGCACATTRRAQPMAGRARTSVSIWCEQRDAPYVARFQHQHSAQHQHQGECGVSVAEKQQQEVSGTQCSCTLQNSGEEQQCHAHSHAGPQAGSCRPGFGPQDGLACGVVVVVVVVVDEGGWHGMGGSSSEPASGRASNCADEGPRVMMEATRIPQFTVAGRGDSDWPDAVQPRVIGLVVCAGRWQGCRQTPLVNTLLSPWPFQYGPVRTASDSPVHAELRRAQRSVARCEPCASAHPKFTKPQSVKGRVPSYQIEKYARACWRRPGCMRGPEAGDLH
jgi:hypothetical protein